MQINPDLASSAKGVRVLIEENYASPKREELAQLMDHVTTTLASPSPSLNSLKSALKKLETLSVETAGKSHIQRQIFDLAREIRQGLPKKGKRSGY
ncbi:MAG: hypothetical protein WC858_01565 [Parcubacteria group bacterium]|jgi:hypothetical protein